MDSEFSPLMLPTPTVPVRLETAAPRAATKPTRRRTRADASVAARRTDLVSDERVILSKPLTPPPPPTAEQIRQRAYEIFLARRGQAGDPVTDWLTAERELTDAQRRLTARS